MMTDVQVQRVLQSTGPQAWPESLAQVEPTLTRTGSRSSAIAPGRSGPALLAERRQWTWCRPAAGGSVGVDRAIRRRPALPGPTDSQPADPPDPPTPAECPCKEELEAIRQEINRLALEVFGIRGLVTKGLWDAKLSHKWLGTLTGTVGPMKGE